MRVFSVPVSAPFLRTVIAALVDGRLVDGFEARHDPARLAQATLYLPTRRAGRLAREIFLDVLKTEAAILPRIVALGDIDEDELAFAEDGEYGGSAPLDIPPKLGELERRLTLAHLVAAWAKTPVSAPLVVGGPASTLALAGDLARLIDDMVTRGVDWNALDGLVPDLLDKYWQHSLEFLRIARVAWPAYLAEIRKIEPAARRDLLIDAEAVRLGKHHDGPVIAAGSTGSMPATAKFLHAVARLRSGAVVLPGLDTDLDEESWRSIGGTRDAQGNLTAQPASNHPQYAMHSLLDRFGIKRRDVDTLGKPAQGGREVLVSETMRPSNATAEWYDRLKRLDIAAQISAGMDKLAVVETSNPEMEALAIAVAMREAHHLEKSAALVTPDRALARRVMAALGRWNLEFDDSGGDALIETSAGIFARLAAEAAAKGLEPPTLLALLKHPLLRLGGAHGGLKRGIEVLERAVLRGTRPQAGTSGLARDFQRFRDELRKLNAGEASSLHRMEPRTRLRDHELDSAQALITALQAALAPLETVDTSKPFDFAELAHRHREVLINLTSDQDGVVTIFDGQQGSVLASAFDDLLSDQKQSGLAVQVGDYPDVFQTAFADRMVRRPELGRTRLAIYGQLEARLTESDRIILGGLVEGVWPPAPRVDPWLSRPMRHQLGLDLPERRIGLSAHDFAQLLGHDEVILTHASKVGGAPAVASRFLHRLEAVAGQERWNAAKAAGEKYVLLAGELDRPVEVKPIAQPAPRPPRAMRPTQLSVTAIEDWLRDPYTIYARHILKLDPLDPVDQPLSAADRGSAIHDALGEFTQIYATELPADPALELRRIGEKFFLPLMERPEARALWWPRFQRIAKWFSEWEIARRENVAGIDAEIRGELKIPLDHERTFTLTARADRIERRSDGSFAILDYKTGAPPTGKQVRMGLSPQLTLEAAILREGGFKDIDADSSVSQLVYVRLSGNNPPGEQKTLELKMKPGDQPQHPDAAAGYAREELEKLIRKFEDENQAYTSLNLSMWAARYGVYDDLARIKEWSAAGGLGSRGMVRAPRPIPNAVRDAQARASDPAASTFVSANAGSGKTHVLVQRVIRLLLAGTPPEKILCITFTKAAAANMAERVFTTLGHWVTLDDDALNDAIREAGIAHPTAKLRQAARKLFACALETPGGLKVQTIHALCTRLLQQFPFEANVPARFAVLDDRDQNEMMERANLAVLLEASRDPDSVMGRALNTAMATAADVTFKEVVREACLSRDQFLAWTKAAGGAAAAADWMSTALGVTSSDRIEDIEHEIVDGPYIKRTGWGEIATVLETSGKSDQDQAARLREALASAGTDQVDKYLDVFLTGERTLRKTVVTKKFGDAHPAFGRLFEAEALRLGPLIEKRRAVIVRDRTEALLHIATAAAANYEREKIERGLLDYDDLIDKTLTMLDRVSSSWVHYKLDRGVDHVLIDEAQDTSPRQWDIVAHIISEFTSGAGARDGVVRTVFAVGDEKQSIFSFQGADPHQFDARRRELRKKFEDAGLKFDPVSFTYSFRSGPTILHSVDHVFRDETIYRSIHAENAYPVHYALSDAGPSTIDLWDLAVHDDKQDIEGWRAPFDGVSVTSPEVKLARRIQTEIKTLVAGPTMTGHEGSRRRLSYGDVLVLVRRRGNLFDAVIQALKHAGIPVAGADRLKLTEHIAIIDLMNLADALLLPQDDLALAVALKSPIFGLDDDDLFKLARDRKGSLRDALNVHAAGDAKLEHARARLEQCERRFLTETPFAFFAWLLGGDGGRARILKRLGHEANDAIDEFLELALSYERKAPASLQGFMAWLRTADLEVKRDMEISRDEVRVMTVHGAKGLESSVVFLADTTTSPQDTQRLRLIDLPDGRGGKVMVWAGRKAEDPTGVAAARTAMLDETEDEYRRLLYVGMTRAADRLVIGGCMPGNMNTVRKNSWYDLVGKGLENSGLQVEEIKTALGTAKRYSRPEDAASAEAAAAPAKPAAPIELPSWLRIAAAPASRSDRSLRPSDPADGESPHIRTGESITLRARALQRGVLVHRLLQSLPEVATDRRRDLAQKYLVRNADGWTGAEREALAEMVLGVISDTRFAPVFAPGSRAEVPIVGRLERPGGPPTLVSGQIDRLVVSPAEVLIVDYKTNHTPPAAEAGAPAGYVRQLALYRAVLGKLYPQLPVRAALLWTETAELMEISTPALDAALATIIQGDDRA